MGNGEKKDGGGSVQRDISEKLYQLCTSKESVSLLVAESPGMSPGEAWKKLYGNSAVGNHHQKLSNEGSHAPAQTRNERAAACGKWGPTKPSELFLTMYRDALHAIEGDTMQALCSPSLMGSCGVLPLTVMSTIPDIARHMANIIVRAEKEVILATNYWQKGAASKFITNAIKELSRRAGERNTKIVMKVLYDRGSLKQIIDQHYLVPESEYTGKDVGLPSKKEIPNIDLQVQNYHHPVLGTFHSKFMVVDRKIALLQSNNIMDNDNVEMMVHMEGPIVDSMYDMALISWNKKLEPPLPSHNMPAAEGGIGSWNKSSEDAGIKEPGQTSSDHPVDSSDHNREDVVTGQTTTASVIHPVNPEHEGAEDKEGRGPIEGGKDLDQTTREWLSKGTQAIPKSQIQKPSEPGKPLPELTGDDEHYDVDIAGEVARVQTAVSSSDGETRMQAVTRHLNHTINNGFQGDAPECDDADEMTPYIPHAVHEPFPIAMVNRPPYGPPNHKSVVNPQNEVWLSAMRNATRTVFIQSPTLNAEPLLPAIVEACERGVDVFCYVCIGYNDTGELLPMQGGHNEMVAHKLFETLSDEGKKHLHYFWYVGKDQTKPIPQPQKKRSCHIKLMIVDERIGIVGSGNQDTQSWYHSQEVNVMLESEEVCLAWIDGLRRNQNTHLYGGLQEDGVWRDKDGNEPPGAMGVDPGRFAWAKGIVGAVKRVQGKGGFG